VGTVTGTAVAADMRVATLPLDGTIRVASESTPLATGTATTTVGAAARVCAGAVTPNAFWTVTLRSFNVQVPLAIAVARTSSGPLADSVAMIVCPPPADVPLGSAGRAQLGLKIVRLTLKLTGAFTVPVGTHVWHLRATPYTAGSALANTAAAAEAEARHTVAPELTLEANAAGAKRSSVSGRLTLGGKAVAGQTVRILDGGTEIAKAKTDTSGAFDATVLLRGAHALLSAKAAVPARYLAACEQPAFAPLPCVTSIVSGFSATSKRIRVA
jgi:hypothetical protein